jgi:ATP-binding cassette, subfamily B, bacterial
MNQKTSFRGAIERIWNLLRLDKRDIYSVYTYSILAGLVSLSLPLGIQSIIGFLMAGSYSTSILILVTLVVIGTFINGLLQVKQLQLIEKVEQKIFVRYALELSDRIPKLNLEALDAYDLSNLVNKFFDLPILQKSLQKLLIEIPPAIFQIIFGTILLSFYHPLFIAFGFLLLLIVSLIIRFTSTAGFRTAMQASDYKYQIAAWFQDLARNILVFKYGKNTDINLKVADGLITEYVKTKTTHFGILTIQYWSLIGFKVLITGVMLIFGVVLLISQKINIGQFIASDIVILSIIYSVEKLIGSMDLVYEALTSVEKLNKIANAEVEKSGTFKLDNSQKSFELELKNVSYVDMNGKTLIADINVKLEREKWLNVFGSNGAGKTFLLHMLAGTYPNFDGKILINGMPINGFDLRWYRSQLGIFIEKQDIFKGSLLSNITLNNVNCNIQNVLEISQMLGLNEFIESTEEGFDTILPSNGKGISNKVRHQIVLARTLANSASLYLLDKPFAYLNEVQEINLLDFLRKTKATVIISSDEAMPGFDLTLNLDKTEDE